MSWSLPLETSLMRPSMLRATRVLSVLWLCLSATLVGCSDGDEAPAETTPPGETGEVVAELRGEIGPEGGTLEGPADGPFAGVKLVVPAGALATKSTLVIRPTFDPTALPELAERVGDQFTLEGGTLAAPVALTLPVDAALVRRFEQIDSDVKVWVRGGEGWTLVEATATARGSVTIPLAALTTAAAGVKVFPQASLCERFPQLESCKPGQPPPVRPAEIPLSQPCNVPEAYCLSKIALATPPPESLDSFEVTSDAIYYLFGESTNLLSAARVDLATGAVSQTLKSHATASTQRNTMAIDGTSVWAGLGPGAGNVRLVPKVTAQVFDTDRNALGALQVPGGPFLRLDATLANGLLTLEVAARNGNTFGPRKPLTLANGDSSPSRIKAEPAGGALWAMQSAHLRRATVAADGTLTPGGSLALPPEGDSFYVDFDVSSTGRIAVLQSNRFGLHDNEQSPFTQLDIGPVFDAVFLGATPLVATSASSPELSVELGGSLLPRRISLTDAPASDPAYTARIPRGIRVIPGTNSAVFLTQGREFFVLRISTSTIP